MTPYLLYWFLIWIVLAKEQQQVSFLVSNTTVGPWDHYWERCVGSDHAAVTLRGDWRDQMKQTHLDLGFSQVRFHGIFVDDLSVVLPGDTPGTLIYSFFNIDEIYDFILSIGMKPIVEVGFMPALLASGNQTWAHFEANVTPPKSYPQWYDFIRNFTQHLVDRYGLEEILTWSFEIWNEPNCCPHDFWTGSQQDYFTLFNWTTTAIKSVDNRIRVGGPTTAMSAWIPEFLSYCQTNNVSFDFVTTHEYPTDPPGPQSRTFFHDVLLKTRQTVGPNIPLYYTEYDDGYNDATSYGAAFSIFTIYSVHDIVDILSWWVFSDIFEEQGQRSEAYSSAGWLPVDGLMNIYGIPKPNYRAFQLLHWTGHQLLDTTPDYTYYDTVSAFAVGGNNTSIFVVNWNVKEFPISEAAVTLNVKGVNANSLKAICYRIDDENTTSYPTWVKMGSPFYLNAEQVAILKEASELQYANIPFQIVSPSEIQFNFSLSPQSVINIILY